MNIPMAILRGVEISLPLLEREPKIILQTALKVHASGIILSHNHPSGNLRPSEPDKQITSKIKEACKVLDLHLLDHIILTEESYYSFTDEGLL